MYVMIDDVLLQSIFSYRQFKKLVASRASFDADRHSDTVYRWYKNDHDLIADLPTSIQINRGEDYLLTASDWEE